MSYFLTLLNKAYYDFYDIVFIAEKKNVDFRVLLGRRRLLKGVGLLEIQA